MDELLLEVAFLSPNCTNPVFTYAKSVPTPARCVNKERVSVGGGRSTVSRWQRRPLPAGIISGHHHSTSAAVSPPSSSHCSHHFHRRETGAAEREYSPPPLIHIGILTLCHTTTLTTDASCKPVVEEHFHSNKSNILSNNRYCSSERIFRHH